MMYTPELLEYLVTRLFDPLMPVKVKTQVLASIEVSGDYSLILKHYPAYESKGILIDQPVMKFKFLRNVGVEF